MNSLIWACLALAAWPSALAVYFMENIEVFEPPTKLRNDSYFGYSITYDEYHKKLVISSPRETHIGEVYTCDIPAKNCTKIPHDVVKPGSPKYTHDYWFGATVKAGRDFVMMCAPRYTTYTQRKSNNMGFNADVTQGRCYTLQQDGKLMVNKWIDEGERILDSPTPMEATMDSFGWSIDVASDDSIIVGGPGMFHGRAMIYAGSSPTKLPKLIRKSKITPEFNFGYAVASGTFINHILSFAVGSPYGKSGLGEVYFYKGLAFQLRLVKAVDESDVGSMFGAVLCAAKLRGDEKRHLTDLLVGAPTYAKKNYYNLGAVYVYLATKPTKSPVFKRKIVGLKSGSMFGSAIVNVHDLNNDKSHEIAIGAPFENEGKGVVYLYSGAALSSKDITDQNLKPLQKILPEAEYGESFGMSLSRLLDYDENGCKELAIGSPYKDKVVLLRCMASVLVETKVEFFSVQGRTKTNRTNFEFEVCLIVTYPSLPKTIKAEISTTVEMNHEYAKLEDPSGRFSFVTSLHDMQPKYCKKVPFNLPIHGKYDTEIGITVSSELKKDLTPQVFDASRVILSDNSALKVVTRLWAAECAGSVCVPNLNFTHFISFEKPKEDPYVIGSSKIEHITITVLNTGEVAYDACVRVHITGANVLKPGGCVYEISTDGDRLKCEPARPIWNSQTWTTDTIELEMNHLTNAHKSINIAMRLFNRCNLNHTRSIEKSIPLKADPRGINAIGETDIGPYVNMTEEDIKENGKKIKHVYTIFNLGPTTWEGLPVNVKLPLHPYIKYDNVSVFYSTSNQYVPCSRQTEKDVSESISYQCLVESLITNVEFAKVLIPMTILPGTLDGLLDNDKNVTIRSFITLELPNGQLKAASTSSIIMLQDAPVPIETIIIAVVVGLCILIIIALILYRIGFLQRKKREELQKLQKSVKRQTILRRSTMPSHSNSASTAEDRKQILEGMKEEDEHAPNLI